MEAWKEEPAGGLQPSFGLEVENLLKAIDAVERLLHEPGERGAVKLVEASNQIKQITATIQALAKLPESRTPANTATATQLRHKTKHLVLWVKQLKLQHDQQQATNNAGGPASPGAAPKAASPLSALGHLSTRRTASLPQPPTAAVAPSNATTSPHSGVHSTLASSTSSSRPIRAATTSSSPTTSPTLLIRNEFNLFSDTFSMPSARSSESTSFAPRSYLSGGDGDGSPASSSPYAPPHLSPQQPQQQDKVRYREGDESMKPRHNAKEEDEEAETESSSTSEDLFTPSSPPADSTFYLIDAKGPGKDVHIPQHEGGDGGKGRRDRSTSNHLKAGRMSGPAGARNPLCGWLHKSGNTFMSPWKRRYFVLDASERPLAVQQYSGFMTWGGGGERRHNKTAPPAMKQTLRLYYYISREDPVPKGFIDLALLDAIRPGVRYKNTFDITIANRVFHLKAETKEEADDWIWELRRWAEWARGRELAPNAREQQEKEERERKEKEEQDKAAASYRSRSASFPAEWFPKLADALLGKSEQAGVAPAPTAVQEKKEESRRSPDTVDKHKHGVAAAADARAKEVDTATQYEAKLQLMEEVVEYKERELWNMRREAEKRTGLNIDDCSVEELEELESELLKALVRIKTVKKKKAKEVRDSIKMDLLQLDVCRACFVNTRRVVYLPCGHFEVCEYCAEKASECHRCNRPIERRVEVRET